MPSETYWSSQNQTPPQPVIQITPLPGGSPVNNITGIDGTANRNPIPVQQDLALFPRFDGETNLLPGRPADFAAPTAERFSGWHSAHKIEHLREFGETVSVTDGGDTLDIRFRTFGTSPDPQRNLHVMLSHDGLRVIVLNGLQAADIARLPLADQRALGMLPVFRTLVADNQALIPNSTELDPNTGELLDVAGARQKMLDEVAVLRATITGAPGFDPANRPLFEQNFRTNPGEAAQYYHFAFLDQLDILSQRLERMGVFSPDRIRQEAGEIIKRFERIRQFENTPLPQPGTPLPSDANSSDDNLSGIVSALNILIGVEFKIYAQTRLIDHVLRTSRLEPGMAVPGALGMGDRVLSGPEVIAFVQRAKSDIAESRAEAETEELNQINRLLQDYTAFQRILNATLSAFDPVRLSNPDEREFLGLKGQSSIQSGSFNDSERKVIAMFDSRYAPTDPQRQHPMEIRTGVARPLLAMVRNDLFLPGTLDFRDRTEWDRFAVSVGQATDLLSQDSQIRMDRISSISREKNRNYDLGSNTLNKMADILRAIIN